MLQDEKSDCIAIVPLNFVDFIFLLSVLEADSVAFCEKCTEHTCGQPAALLLIGCVCCLHRQVAVRHLPLPAEQSVTWTEVSSLAHSPTSMNTMKRYECHCWLIWLCLFEFYILATSKIIPSRYDQRSCKNVKLPTTNEPSKDISWRILTCDCTLIATL